MMLSFKFSKRELAACYLKVAYYGKSLEGASGIESIKAVNLSGADVIIVAYLKYPRTSSCDSLMVRKHLMRVRHIGKLLSGTNDVSMSTDARSVL